MPQHVQGLDGVLDNMRELDAKVQKKIMRHALRAGAKPIQAEAKQQAKQFDDPSTPGQKVWKQIATRTMKARAAKAKGYDLGVKIGVKHSNPGEEYHYAVFLEHGTSEMAAQPFLRPAADTQQTEALNAIATDLWQGIRKHSE